MVQRLDKLLADAENCTRSQARAMIRRGEISVDGAVVRDSGWKADPDKQEITLYGRPVCTGPCYIMMNKPVGVVSSTSAGEETTVLDLLPASLRRKGLFPAGRLDKDTTGFMLITNDGAFAHEILSPRRHVEKEYVAQLEHPADLSDVQVFARGMALPDGTVFDPGRLELDETRMKATVIIQEGRYHQVKRMFEFVGNNVLCLKRIRIGGLYLDERLAPGEARFLMPEEVLRIRNPLSPPGC